MQETNSLFFSVTSGEVIPGIAETGLAFVQPTLVTLSLRESTFTRKCWVEFGWIGLVWVKLYSIIFVLEFCLIQLGWVKLDRQ